jgi:hypothetical protein
MKIKYNPKTLVQLEKIFTESGYGIRYEKGNFQSGYCILKDKKVVVVNKYYPLDGKINCLIEILQGVDWDFAALSGDEKALFDTIKDKQLKIDLQEGEMESS